MSHSAFEKLAILNEVYEKRRKVVAVCKEAGISRKTFYSWRNLLRSSVRTPKIKILSPRYLSGKNHPKSKRHLFRNYLLPLALAHPEWGSRKLCSELIPIFGKVSNHTVYNALEDFDLGTKEKRETFCQTRHLSRQILPVYKSLPLRLSPTIRKRSIEEYLFDHRPMDEICCEYSCSRKTFYKWLKRYLSAKNNNEDLLDVLQDHYRKGSQHYKLLSEDKIQAILGYC